MTIDLARICGIGDEAATDLAGQIAIHTQLEMAGIEVRAVDGVWLHEIDDALVAEMGRSLAEAGLAVPVVDTPVGNWARTVRTDLNAELDLLTVYARRARMLGCSQLRIMSYPNVGLSPHAWAEAALDRIGWLVEAAEREGVRLLHENCAGWAGQSADATIQMMERFGGEHLGLIFDIGNGKAYGYDPAAFLAATVEWVHHIHVKDAVATDDGAAFVFPGEGECDVPACLRMVHQASRECWVSIEPHLATMPHLGITAAPAALRSSYLRYAEQSRQLIVDAVGKSW